MKTQSLKTQPLKTKVTAVALVLALALVALPALAAEVVNINTADSTALMRLPRVGPSLAARIVEHRDANGEFNDVDELMLVSGIGERTFELIKPWVTTSGDTTLQSKVSMRQALERLIRADTEQNPG